MREAVVRRSIKLVTILIMTTIVPYKVGYYLEYMSKVSNPQYIHTDPIRVYLFGLFVIISSIIAIISIVALVVSTYNWLVSGKFSISK